MSSDFGPSAPPDLKMEEIPRHQGKVIPSAAAAAANSHNGQGCHPSDAVAFFNQTSPDSSRSSANPPLERMCSPASGAEAQSLARYPFLFNNQNFIYTQATESEKYKKMRQRKDKRNKGKNINVKEEFVTQENGARYDVDEIMKSMGETNEQEKKTQKSMNNCGNSSNGKKMTNGQMQWKKLKESKAGNDAVATAKSKSSSQQVSSDEGNRAKEVENDEKTVIEQPAKQEAATSELKDTTTQIRSESEFEEPKIPLTNGFLSGDTISGDLKLQMSKSTENLSNFTMVTMKKKWGKKKATENADDASSYLNLSQNNHRYKGHKSTSGYNLHSRACHDFTNSNNRTPHDSSRSSSTSHSEKSLPRNQMPEKGFLEQVVLQQKQKAANATNQKKQQPPPTNLDLSTDFPSLLTSSEDVNPASDSNTSNTSTVNCQSPPFQNDPVKTVWGSSNCSASHSPSNTNDSKPSDALAVINQNGHNDDSNHSTQQPPARPPNITYTDSRNNISKMSSLPDIAAQASVEMGTKSISSNSSNSREATPTNVVNLHKGAEERGSNSRDISSRNSTASFFLDTENNIEIVLCEEEYNRRNKSDATPVIILGNSENSLEDWTETREIEFGFGLNKNLLLSSDQLQPTIQDKVETKPESNTSLLMDNAIVSFGDLVMQDIKKFEEHNETDYTTLGSNVSIPQQQEACYATSAEYEAHAKIVNYVSSKWLAIELELKIKKKKQQVRSSKSTKTN